MHFSTKSYLKNTRNHTDKQNLREEITLEGKRIFAIFAAVQGVSTEFRHITEIKNKRNNNS